MGERKLKKDGETYIQYRNERKKKGRRNSVDKKRKRKNMEDAKRKKVDKK